MLGKKHQKEPSKPIDWNAKMTSDDPKSWIQGWVRNKWAEKLPRDMQNKVSCEADWVKNIDAKDCKLRNVKLKMQNLKGLDFAKNAYVSLTQSKTIGGIRRLMIETEIQCLPYI